jgi:serine/threonine-protein kinase
MAHLGVFSPAPVAITMAIGFFGFSIDREHALYISLAAIISYTIICGSVTFEFIPDPGLFSSEHLAFSTKLSMFILVPMILTSTLWLARLSRRTMLECVDRAARAMELADRRQELLVEAKQDLEHALRAGSGKSGRYTNQNAGSYQLGPLVSQGAIGEIYRARHRRDTQPAAVKVLQAATLHRNNAVMRFMREGQIATSLNCEYIVKTHEVGQLSDELPYMAMEWLDGEDLASRLRRDTTLPLVIACEFVDHIGQGLACAHDSNIVHRDLKPSNIFWARSSANTPTSWKILDFGVSKLLHADQTLTEDGLIGTPGYMAPEQARGQDADARSDIFSFGAVVYRALTGRPPFAAPNLPQTLYRLAYINPPCPMTAGHPMSKDVARVLAIALAKAPKDRFQSATAFTDAFAAAANTRLSETYRQHADALLAKYPWGADTSGRQSSTI